MEIWLMELARGTSKVIDKISDWICIRLDYYVEAKEWEIRQRNESFPPEWFMTDKQIKQLEKRENNEK